jgi:maleylacetate reductase
MLPYVLRYNESANADRQRLVAEAMGHPGERAADVVSKFISDLGLPRRLSEVKVSPDQFRAIAEHTAHDPWLYTNPRKMTGVDDVMELLNAAA